MGYRSDVMFVIRGTKPAIVSFLAAMRLTMPDVKGDPCWKFIKHSTSNPHASYIWMQEEGIKWYESFESVRFFEAFWDAAAEQSSNGDDPVGEALDGCFIRIGEDDEDNETRYFGNEPHGMISLSRSVSVDVDLVEDKP